MTCPHLVYREDAEERSFDHERPYCQLSESFVTPMKADVCNDRYDFDHCSHCGIFREAEGASDRIASR